MRLIYSASEPPILMGKIQELNDVQRQLALFLDTGQAQCFFAADMSRDPAPYEENLPGIEFILTEGPICVALGDGRRFCVSGSAANLRVYGSHFHFCEDEEGEHHHPDQVKGSGYMDPGALALIIEAEFD